MKYGLPEDINVEDLAPVVKTLPGGPPKTNPSIVHEHGNLEHTDV